MAMDLDTALRRLAAEPTHPGLESLEPAVFARIAAQQRSDVGSPVRLGMLAAIVAVVFGVASAGTPTSIAQAAPVLSPFGPASPLAPSTLLMGVR